MHVRFGNFTLDSESRRLCRGARDRHLSPKSFELLRLLLDHRPNVVSKREVHEHLWPSTFVSDATLTSLVAELRHALGENARHVRFVRTVHRVGYAFQGVASELEADARSRGPQARCWIMWDSGQMALGDGSHLLGRDRDVAVWLESPTVSRHHARICVAGAQATIEDLGSKNGTYLRGIRLADMSLLRDGDQICIGSVEVQFRRLETSASTETHRPR
jgi:DNA-binding winged helix-turn-helix (wHTH) protein